jgi:hypothetical protein
VCGALKGVRSPRLRACAKPSLCLATCGSVFIVLIALSVAGCHGVNPAELDFTRAEPAKADVVGKWALTSDSLKETKPSTSSTQELDLREDGSFSVVDLPTSPDVAGASPKGLLSGSGVWHLDRDQDGFTVWVINLDFASHHHRETVHLRHQRPPYLIHIFMGDPDSGRAMLLKRVP